MPSSISMNMMKPFFPFPWWGSSFKIPFFVTNIKARCSSLSAYTTAVVSGCGLSQASGCRQWLAMVTHDKSPRSKGWTHSLALPARGRRASFSLLPSGIARDKLPRPERANGAFFLPYTRVKGVVFLLHLADVIGDLLAGGWTNKLSVL